MASDADTRVDLVGATQFVHRHLTASMCESVFRELRSKERARLWTLHALAEFWVAVVLRAPRSLREAIEEARAGRMGLSATSPTQSSFFERSQKLRWEFFREVYDRFIASLLPDCAQGFESELRAQLATFPEVWAVDGSGLDRVAHRLKVVQRVRKVVIPGSVLVLYDLFRGVPRAVHFNEKLLGGEARRLREVAHTIPAGTLLVADRGFSSVRLIAELAERGIDAVVRLKSNIKAGDVEDVERLEDEGAEVIDRVVTIGTGQRAPKARVRLIEKTLPDGSVLRLAVTVTDRRRLPAAAALALYRRRWAVERMFQHLKQVLNLRRFYAANTNAVAMQLYASAIVYAGLRATQCRLAQEHARRPEEISPAKLFPRIAAAHFRLVATIEGFELARSLNPGVDLAEPDWGRLRLYDVPLSSLIVTKRQGCRRSPGYSAQRKLMTALRPYERRRRRPRSRDP